MTQDNTPLGSEIVYDGYPSKRLKVSSGLLEILPEVEVLFDGEYNSQSAHFSLVHSGMYQVGGFVVGLYCSSVMVSEFLLFFFFLNRNPPFKSLPTKPVL